LIRQEPFTRLNVTLQGGRFDVPDRIFFNMALTWDGCNRSMSDVKELVPELYCCPEVLLNTNKYDLGELQDGVTRVHDVVLPPWAKGSPFDFVRLHRDALESDFVSQHLHEWVDLIFGFKQTGEAAVEADNVFYYMTYEDGVDLDAIEDETTLEATKTQIMYFGQTPSQVFARPHLERLPRESCVTPLCWAANKLASLQVFTPAGQLGRSGGRVVALHQLGERFVTVHEDLSLCYYRWTVDAPPERDCAAYYHVVPERRRVLPSVDSACTRHIMVTRGQSAEGMYDSGMPSGAKEVGGGGSGSGGGGVGGGLGSALSGLTSLFGDSTPRVRTHTASASAGASWLFGETPLSHSKREESSSATATAKSHFSFGVLLKPLRNNNVAVNVDPAGMVRVISSGYWDSSVKVHSLETLRDISTVTGHLGDVTCVLPGGDMIITGGSDGVVRVWQAGASSGAILNSLNNFTHNLGMGRKDPKADASTADDKNTASAHELVCTDTLVGLVAPVSALCYNKELGVVVSGSVTGRLCVHMARSGVLLRSICDLEGRGISVVCAADQGYIAVHTAHDKMLTLFWVNGQRLAQVELSTEITCMAVNRNTSNVFVCGHEDGSLSFRHTWDLEVVRVIDTLKSYGAISSVAFSHDTQVLLVGSKSGTFSVVADGDREVSAEKSRPTSPPMMI